MRVLYRGSALPTTPSPTAPAVVTGYAAPEGLSRLSAPTRAGRIRIEQGRAAFNRGEYFQAHELWEETWRQITGVERILLQGLIQIAAGLHHLKERRPRPAAGLLRKGLAKVSRGASAAPFGLPVAALACDVGRLLAELQTPQANAPDLTSLKL
jgi:Domain of unknown function (DUF309)